MTKAQAGIFRKKNGSKPQGILHFLIADGVPAAD